MPTLKELIDLHCPDGVDYVRLGDIAEIGTGGCDRKNATEDGGYPFFVRSETVLRYPSFQFDEEAIIIPGEGRVGEVFHHINGKYALHQRAYRVHLTNNNVSTRFVLYALQTGFKSYVESRAVTATVTSLRKPMLTECPLPHPPREVQDKIVDMLDAFAAVCDNLDEEIAQREEQFDLYRKNILIDLQSAYPSSTLGQISDQVKTGATPKAGNPRYYDGGTIPWLRTGEVAFNTITDTEVKVTDIALKETAIKWVEAPSIVVAISGATAGKSAIIDIPLTTNQHCCCLHIDSQQADHKFAFHWTAMQYEHLKSLGRGARGDLNTSIIKSLEIPLPPLPVQQDIADKLDAMQALIDNLKLEREQRQQQFEYYRTQLLTFPAKDTADND